MSIANNATGTFTGVGVLPFVLVLASLLLIAFLLIALRRGQKTLVSAANTDALTGLCNRRRLVADLDTELARATDADPVLLMLCDLNGFKAYNDTFGHPAGDALLARLGAALARDIGAKGRAYRIGGDEFCVLARPGRDGIDEVIDLATRALSEQGDGFSITTSHGAILLPTDASVGHRGDARRRPAHVREQEQQPDTRRRANHQRAAARHPRTRPGVGPAARLDRRPGRRGVPAARRTGGRRGPHPAGGSAA